MSEDQRRAWRKALSDLHKQQRRDRGSWKRKPASPGPGMLRRPAPRAPAEPDETAGPQE